MNLPMRLLLTAGLVTMLFTAFSKKTLPTESKDLTATTAPKQQLLYWYDPWYDMLQDHKTIADEEYLLWVMYGYAVDQTPGGGTLLMRGYINNAYPHNTLPLAMLYGHFPFMLDREGEPVKK